MEDAKKTPAAKELPDAFELFKPSWKAFQLNFETFVWQLLLPMAITGLTLVGFVIAIFAYRATDVIIPLFAAGLLGLAGLWFIVVITASLVVTELKSARRQVVGFREALGQIQGNIWKLIGLFIIVTFAVCIGLVLFILPGLFAMQRLLLSPYFLVDQKLGVFESMRRSWRAGKNRRYSGVVWGVVGIIIAINLVSWVPFVGWLASLILVIMYFCAPAILYTLVAEKSAAKPSAAVEN